VEFLMARGQRNIPGLQQRFALKGKLLVTKWKGQTRVSKWPKPYGPPRSQAQADTIAAFKKIQRALKFLPASQTITAMNVTAKTGMYPRDLLMQGMTGTNILLAYDNKGTHAMIGDGIDQQIISSGITNFDFSNIPGGYSALWLTIIGRTLASGNAENPVLQFNADGGPHYDYNRENRFGSGQGVSVTGIILPTMNGSTAPAGYPSVMEILIPGYASSSFFKSILARGNWSGVHAGADFSEDRVDAWWQNTNPIARLFTVTSAGWAQGSTCTLYGLF
jgi:hypothetical protein